MKLQDVKFVRTRRKNGRNSVLSPTRGGTALQTRHFRGDSVSSNYNDH